MTDKKENKEWENREIGALWVNAKSGGDKYLTGHINKEKVIVFKNSRKRMKKLPTFESTSKKSLVLTEAPPLHKKKRKRTSILFK